MFKIFDRNGIERDTGWLTTYFGDVEHHEALGGVDSYRVLEVYVSEGTASKNTIVTVLDAQRQPKVGIRVTCRRIDGSEVMRKDTDRDGMVIFETTKSYPVPGQGPYLVTIPGDNDAVIGLGNVMRAHRHLNVVFQFVPANEIGPGDHEELRRYIFERVDEIRSVVNSVTGDMVSVVTKLEEINQALDR